MQRGINFVALEVFKIVIMNINKFYALLFALCTISCSKELEITTNEEVNISFSVGVTNSSRAKVSTGNNFKTTFDNNDVVGLFIYIRNEGEEPSIDENELYVNNITITLKNGIWELEQPIYYPDGKKLLDIYAYYPYKNGADVHSVEYNAHEEMTELLIASIIGAKKSEDAIMLKFQHTQSLVHVTLTKDNNVPDFDENLKVYFNGVVGGKYNIATQELTEPLAGIIQMDIASAAGANARSYVAFIPEQIVTSGILFSVFQMTSDNEILSSKDINQPETFSRGQVRLFFIQIKQEIPKNITYYKYDLYPKYGTPIGLVVETYNGGKNGLIISLKDITGLEWATSDASSDATDINDGISNTMKIQRIENWETKYPAFNACISLGERWYVPSIGEMSRIFANGLWDYTLRNLNDNLQYHGSNNPELGIETINPRMSYFSSTESSATHATKLYTENGAWVNDPKYYAYNIRPFYVF